MITIFWISFMFILYTYAGFPLTLWLLAAFKRSGHEVDEGFYPAISLVIPAYNEEKIIEEKIKNSLSLEYPEDKFQIVVISDGSTDKIGQIVKRHENSRLKFISYAERFGKLEAIKNSIGAFSGDVLIFTDADVILEKNALLNIVKPFKEKLTGAVSANLEYSAPGNFFNFRNLYWKIEQSVRMNEAKLGVLCFVAGPFWAARKDLMAFDVPAHAAFDAVIPMGIVRQGYFVTAVPDARAVTLPYACAKEDFKALSRTVNRGFQAILYNKSLLNFFKYPLISFCLIWHKLMRWLTPFFLFALFLSSIALSSDIFYRYMFMGQVIFYAFAAIGFLVPRARKVIFFLLPFYVCLNLAASFTGLWQSIFNKRLTFWQTRRI